MELRRKARVTQYIPQNNEIKKMEKSYLLLLYLT